jgi:rod shape-determining protein MreC
VQVNRTGLRTIAVGTGDPRRLSLPYLPRNADVRDGDLLLSSGLGGVFPSGYPVARVTDVVRDAAQPLAKIDAEPAAALDRDRELLLIWFDARVPEPEPEVVPAPAPTAPAAATPAAPSPASVATTTAVPQAARPPATTPATTPTATPATGARP